jgi:methanogenic corrinoid protein MtbC1
VADLINKAQSAGIDTAVIVQSALVRAVRKGSARYEARQCFLPEILLIADAFYRAYASVQDNLADDEQSPVDVVLGTVQGDIHEIGKDLVRILLQINGFSVLDLGVNVAPESFLRALRTSGASIVGLSVFLTSSRQWIAETVKLLREPGQPPVAILVGGAAANDRLATTVDAYGYAKDAVGAVKLVRQALKERGSCSEHRGERSLP